MNFYILKLSIYLTEKAYLKNEIQRKFQTIPNFGVFAYHSLQMGIHNYSDKIQHLFYNKMSIILSKIDQNITSVWIALYEPFYLYTHTYIFYNTVIAREAYKPINFNP